MPGLRCTNEPSGQPVAPSPIHEDQLTRPGRRGADVSSVSARLRCASTDNTDARVAILGRRNLPFALGASLVLLRLIKSATRTPECSELRIHGLILDGGPMELPAKY